MVVIKKYKIMKKKNKTLKKKVKADQKSKGAAKKTKKIKAKKSMSRRSRPSIDGSRVGVRMDIKGRCMVRVNEIQI